MSYRILQLALALAFITLAGGAAAAGPVDQAVQDKLRSVLEAPSMGMKVDTVEHSEIPNLYEVRFKSGPVVYATASGDYFIAGDLFSAGPDGFVNLAEKRRGGVRAAQLATVDEKDMIIFSPAGKTRSHITVFTDISCYYCQKLHQEVPELNKRGVEVRYLAYPRAGVDSEAYRQLVTAWCADDRQDTLTRLKARQTVPNKTCKGNPVADQFLLGQQVGVRGTPALVTEDGQLIPGYQSADDLMATLGLN